MSDFKRIGKKIGDESITKHNISKERAKGIRIAGKESEREDRRLRKVEVWQVVGIIRWGSSLGKEIPVGECGEIPWVSTLQKHREF